MENLLIVFVLPWLTISGWLTLIATLVIGLIIRRVWLVVLISLLISFLSFFFILQDPEPGFLSIGIPAEWRGLMSIGMTGQALFIIWLVRWIAKKLGWPQTPSEQEDGEQK